MKKKHILVLIAMLAAFFTATAQADEFLDKRWYAAPYAGYLNPGGDRGAEDGYTTGLGIGKIIDEHFNVELKGFHSKLGSDGSGQGNWEMSGGLAEAQYFFTRDAFAPYTVFGLGGMHTNFDSNQAASFIGEAGTGFTYEVHDNFLVRSDIRYRYNHNSGESFGRDTDQFHDMLVNVGFVIPFGPKPVAEVAFEAPTPAPVAAPDCATLDDDNDGVNNCIDQCPHSLAGSKVDAQGCPVSLELKGVNFHHDSAELTQNAMYILDTVADNLIQYPDKHDIEVRGHASSEGSSAHNLALTNRRSQSVVDYLKMRGVTNNLIARGMGEDYPVADNSTEAGRSANRRVELIWMGN